MFLSANTWQRHLGWVSAGYWEALWRLSAAYLMLITTTLSVYYLPRLSELKDPLEIKKEIMRGYKVILPIAILAACIMYTGRGLIVNLLFSTKSSPICDLFLGQVIGDILKIGSWLMAFLMLGKAMTKYFIMTEIIFSTSFYFMIVLMTNYFGLQGVSWAYAINYLAYWLTIYFLVFRNLNSEKFLCPSLSAI